MSWYRTFRQFALQEWSFRLIAQIGSGAFSTISGEVVNADLFITTRGLTEGSIIEYFVLDNAVEKESLLITISPIPRPQRELGSNPEAPLNYRTGTGVEQLKKYAGGFAGIQSGDYPRFGRLFWEVVDLGRRWRFSRVP